MLVYFYKKIYYADMRKRFCAYLFISVFCGASYGATSNYIPKKFSNLSTHADTAVPYMLNNAQPSTKTVRTNTSTSTKRGVVKRANNNNSARSTTNNSSSNFMVQPNTQNSNRRVVQRNNSARATATNTTFRSNTANRAAVTSGTTTRLRAANATNTTTYADVNTSSQRCFADYKECMDAYCERTDAAYNRCYCSAKLAQIDSKYQNKIDSLIQQIVRLQYSNQTTSDEIKDYWDETVGVYTGTNPWINIDNALDINWADNESRVRGQNAFNVGHQYCVQNLRSCYYMASNLRDAYKSEIARDCAEYENGLQKIQMAAESVIENYND